MGMPWYIPWPFPMTYLIKDQLMNDVCAFFVIVWISFARLFLFAGPQLPTVGLKNQESVGTMPCLDAALFPQREDGILDFGFCCTLLKIYLKKTFYKTQPKFTDFQQFWPECRKWLPEGVEFRHCTNWLAPQGPVGSITLSFL